jgi:hypothetical protein
MSTPPILVDSLALHARGRTLALSIGAGTGAPPPEGTIIAFAKDFQEHPARAAELLTWTERPGRLLVLVPPFARTAVAFPVEWEARRTESLAGGETRLGALLARERQHELRGALLPLERGGGQTVTGGWRRHPAAGLLAITALPLWSLHTLDHRPVLSQWLDNLFESAGSPLAEETRTAPLTAELSADDWTLLLHLCRGPFDDAPAALRAFTSSGIQRLRADDAAAVLRSLELRGLIEGGQLTDLAGDLLDDSPYAVYATELRSTAHG